MEISAINPIRSSDAPVQSPKVVLGESEKEIPDANPRTFSSSDTVSLSKKASQVLGQGGDGSSGQNPVPADVPPQVGPGDPEANQQRELSITENHEVVLKIVDSETQEVVRQLPSEESIRLREAVRRFAEEFSQGTSSE